MWLRKLAVIATLILALGPLRSARASGTEDDLTPRQVEGYKQGRRKVIKVVIVGWAAVEVSTAEAFIAMRDAAAADGVELWIRSGFRDMETQRWLYQAWKEGYGNKAAKPGYSNHQSGKALDLVIDAVAVWDWLEANGKKFGFKRTVPGEPWHWEFVKKPKKSKKSAVAKKTPTGAQR